MKRISYLLPLSLTAALLAPSAVFAQVAAPQLQIITPSDGQTIYGNRVPILFAVQNFNIVEKASANPSGTEGYILIWLDDKNPTADTATKVMADSFTYSDVAYGDHTLKAELVTPDNKPLSPDQTVTVNFKNAPITSPTPAATEGFDKNTTLVILVVVALVIVAAWWYTREEDEEEVASQSKSPTRTNRGKKPKSTSKGKKTSKPKKKR